MGRVPLQVFVVDGDREHPVHGIRVGATAAAIALVDLCPLSLLAFCTPGVQPLAVILLTPASGLPCEHTGNTDLPLQECDTPRFLCWLV